MTQASPPPLPLIFSVTITGILANTLVGPAIPDILDAFGQPDSRAGVFVAAGTLVVGPSGDARQAIWTTLAIVATLIAAVFTVAFVVRPTTEADRPPPPPSQD